MASINKVYDDIRYFQHKTAHIIEYLKGNISGE